jgi:hypothetical protein
MGVSVDPRVLEAVLAEAVARLDVAALRATFRDQNQFLYLERWLPPAVLEPCLADVERVRPYVHRAVLPGHKKGGSVSAFTLARRAPAITALYRSTALLDLLRRLTGQGLEPCPPRDPHACALYFYTEPGDHIGFHYDTSYYRGARYTVLVGLIERSSSRLVAQPWRGHPERAAGEIRLATDPGTVVVFNGDTLWHAITPLGPGEERVSLSLEYVSDPRMTLWHRFVSDMKDALAYFGFRTVFGRRG